MEGTLGWSCPDCENLGMLLGEEETQQIIEEFDRLHRPWDCRIQLDDWLDKKRKDFEDLHDVVMADDSLDQLAQEFRIFVVDDEVDEDGINNNKNAITWMDFLGMESLKWLHKQPKSHLVGLLHPREVRRMKAVFARHDLSGSSETAIGIVDGDGADKVFAEWLRELGVGDEEETHLGSSRRGSRIRRKSLAQGGGSGSGSGSGGGSVGGSYGSNLQTWQAFLLDKALCIIAARPNPVVGGKNYVKFAVQLEKRNRD